MQADSSILRIDGTAIESYAMFRELNSVFFARRCSGLVVINLAKVSMDRESRACHKNSRSACCEFYSILFFKGVSKCFKIVVNGQWNGRITGYYTVYIKLQICYLGCI